ncbi:hypothetical protein AVEN_141857-1 [Araneus ventricosus]|uniref:Uncharacterized protein n=1 Tax=Araneus ventricosus TaxID=182803 RepID=A0A4Y2L2D7_ARAVE|nr:hypothetical protein AVEN_141857-1 [Araneus ventricosus]
MIKNQREWSPLNFLEKDAVSPVPAWIKKFEPIVTQDPMAIRKYLGKESNPKMSSDLHAYRFLLLIAQGQSHIILLHAQISTSTHALGESDLKKAPSRSQKISSTEDCGQYACVWRWSDSLEMQLYRPTDSQPFDGFGPKFYTDLYS